jgi:hypothetical protein
LIGGVETAGSTTFVPFSLLTVNGSSIAGCVTSTTVFSGVGTVSVTGGKDSSGAATSSDNSSPVV